jgi:hypothetical protein
VKFAGCRGLRKWSRQPSAFKQQSPVAPGDGYRLSATARRWSAAASTVLRWLMADG